MTDLEKESLFVFMEIRDRFSAGRITRETFMGVMGHIRDMIGRLENKKFGCPTGLHSGKCTCKPPVLGKCA